MQNAITFVGLDAHARFIKAVSLDVMTGELKSAIFGYDDATVAGWASSLPQPARCVYESGVTGFDPQKKLSSLDVDCVISTASKMIKPAAGRRRKSYRNDAEFLARTLSVGNVVEVWVPDNGCEAACDLARALEDTREEVARSKQLLSKFPLRHGLFFTRRCRPASTRTTERGLLGLYQGAALRGEADADVFAHYVDRVRQAADEKSRPEKLMAAKAERPRGRDAPTPFAASRA